MGAHKYGARTWGHMRGAVHNNSRGMRTIEGVRGANHRGAFAPSETIHRSAGSDSESALALFRPSTEKSSIKEHFITLIALLEPKLASVLGLST